MRSSEDVIYNLIKKSENPNYAFERVYRNLYNPNLYFKVLENIKVHKESEEVRKIIYSLIEEIKLETYKPMKLETNFEKQYEKFYFKDKIVQEIINLILNSIYFGSFKQVPHVYMGKESFQKCLFEIKKWNESNWFIKFSIEDCFNKTNQEKLIDILSEKIHDHKFIRLIRKFLKSGYLNNDNEGNKKISINTTLFNIYLNNIDKDICKIIKDENSGKLLNTPCFRSEENYKIKYLRCGTDFLIGVCGNKQLSLKIKHKIQSLILNEFNLKLCEENIKIINAYKGIHFLSYEIKKVKENNLNKIELNIPKNFIRDYGIKENIIKDVNNNNWIYKAKYNKINLSDLKIFLMYKKQKDLLCKYYSMASNFNTVISKVEYMLKMSCFKTIAHKHRKSQKEIMDKYRIDNKNFGMEYIHKNGKTKKITWNNTYIV